MHHVECKTAGRGAHSTRHSSCSVQSYASWENQKCAQATQAQKQLRVLSTPRACANTMAAFTPRTQACWDAWLSDFDDANTLRALSAAMVGHKRIVASSGFSDGARRVFICHDRSVSALGTGDEVWWDRCHCKGKTQLRGSSTAASGCACLPTTRTLLHLAVQLRVQRLFDAVLAWNKDLVHVADGDGRTPLFFCLSSSKYDREPQDRVFRAALLDAGAHIDQRDAHGTRVVVHAMEAGHIETVMSLLHRGAAPITKDDFPLHV